MIISKVNVQYQVTEDDILMLDKTKSPQIVTTNFEELLSMVIDVAPGVTNQKIDFNTVDEAKEIFVIARDANLQLKFVNIGSDLASTSPITFRTAVPTFMGVTGIDTIYVSNPGTISSKLILFVVGTVSA